MEIFERILELRRAGTPAVLVTVVGAQGSTPRKLGARMLVLGEGTSEGTVGGGKIEYVVQQAAVRLLAGGEAQTLHYDLGADLGMACGGRMSFLLEPLGVEPPLIVFGCGHVGAALIRAAAPLGFRITAVDDLPQYANPERLPQAARVVCSYKAADLQDLPFSEHTYVVVVTREHKMDQEMVELCAGKPLRYLGVIGSLRKALAMRERLRERGVDSAFIERIRCPVGVDIGAETPEEIAVAITAELVSLRRGGPKFKAAG